jgi:hypothetical protein
MTYHFLIKCFIIKNVAAADAISEYGNGKTNTAAPNAP